MNPPALLAPFSALCQLFLISDLSTEITMEMGPSVSNSALPHLVPFCPSHPGCLKKVSQDSMKYLLTPWVQDPGAFFREKFLDMLEVSYGLGCPRWLLSVDHVASTAEGIIFI